MSGGSYDYVCYTIENLADSIESRSPTDPLRVAFTKHLRLVAKAAHDIEWVDSGDYGRGDDEAAIRAVLHPAAEINAAIQIAEDASANLLRAIQKGYEATGGPDA